MKNITNLEDHLGYWLRFVSNQVSSSFKKRLEEVGVTVAEWVALRLLYTNEASPALLAEKIGMTRGAMTKVLDRLIDQHLILRAESVEDRRYQKITLTQKGRDLVPLLAKIADENEVFYFSHLSEEEKQTLTHILEKTIKFHHLKHKPLD